MPPHRHPLTPAVQEMILSYVRAGGYPQVAAEAAGVPRAAFDDWMSRGQGPRAPRPYRAFAAAVLQAHAQARLKAEVSVFTDKPLEWLKSGPGKETPDRAGWSTAAKPHPAGAASNPFLDPGLRQLIADLLRALAPFPEIRTSVAASLPDLSPAGRRRRA